MNDFTFALLLLVLVGLVMAAPLATLAYGWRLWNKARKKRLRWAMIHANLLTTLLLAGLFVVYEGVSNLHQLPAALSGRSGLYLVTAIMVPLFSIVVAMPVVIILMLFSGTIAYYVARPLISQLETLVEQMDRLRAGDYRTRSIVEGQQEIQRLQLGFNAMAAELEIARQSLENERDHLARVLASRRELFAEVSHELRTPTAIMRGYVDSLLTNWQDVRPPDMQQDLQTVSHEIDRLQRLIDDLFLLARAEIGQLALHIVPTDIGSLIEQTVQTVAPLAWERGRVRVSAEIEVQLPAALADSIRLEQILQNLLQNAIRHTAPGGIVIVRAGVSGPKHVQIEVDDTGEGIDSAELAHIWQRFYQGSGKVGAAGIGLALVNDLATAMSGQIAVESVPGQGTCFKITLLR